jgi:hypothetical protein
VNKTRLLFSWIAVFLFIFVYEWLFHGILLKDMYTQTANLWRTEEEMSRYFHWLIIGQLMLSVVFCFIFTKCYENKSICEGLRYGLWMGLFLSSPNLIMYAVAPYPWKLIATWTIGGVIEFTIAGVILSMFYSCRSTKCA